MRLFVAIELDDAARQAILAEQNRLKRFFDGSDRSSLRWVKPEHIHLTLVFLGELQQDDGDKVIQVMSEAIQHDRFAIAFRRLGIFPPRGLPRVLWLACSMAFVTLWPCSNRLWSGSAVSTSLPRNENEPFGRI